jgi:hypothetical protein
VKLMVDDGLVDGRKSMRGTMMMIVEKHIAARRRIEEGVLFRHK